MDKNLNYLYQLLEKWKVDFLTYLPKIFLSLVVLVAVIFLSKKIRKFSYNFYSKVFSKQEHIAKYISIVLYTITLLFGLFLILEILGLESVLSKVLAGAGIIGIVAGFAFKDIAANTFAGLLVNIQKPIKKGDWVTINSHFGKVTSVGWINTSLKTVYGQEVYIPNQIIYNNSFTNFSTYGKRRVALQSGVSYGDDLEHVKKVALDEINKLPHIAKNTEIEFYFLNIGSYSYNFEVRFWIKFNKQTDYLQAMSDAIINIKKRFEQEDISLAYPVQTLDFDVKGGVNIFDKPINIKS